MLYEMDFFSKYQIFHYLHPYYERQSEDLIYMQDPFVQSLLFCNLLKANKPVSPAAPNASEDIPVSAASAV